MERDYQALQRLYQSAQLSHNETRAKERALELSERLELEQQGAGRFELLEPASRPELPSGPNRAAFILLGFVLAVATAVAATALLEVLDNGIYHEQQLKRLTGTPLVASVSYIDNSVDHQQRFRSRLLIGGAFAAGALALALTHYYLTLVS